MPPSRRHAGNTAASPSTNQSTLSFGSKARVTKPSATTPASQKAKGLEPLVSRPAAPKEPSNDVAEPQQVPVTPSEPSKPHVAELAVRGQAKVETQPQREPWGEEDKKALGIGEKDLQRYWKQEEQGRIAPRVHQNDLTLHQKILRHFDLCSQYGPCIGIARIKRWRRANMLNLHPPIEVLAVLLKDQEDVRQRSYMDELMS